MYSACLGRFHWPLKLSPNKVTELPLKKNRACLDYLHNMYDVLDSVIIEQQI